MTSLKVKNRGSTIASRGVLFTLLWWVLTNGAASSWWVGGPAVLLAVAASVALLPPAPFVWREVPRFAPFFLMRSLRGGADVAWRAFHPGMPIAPDLINYPLRLSPGLPQVFMANMVSLLPGTLAVALERNGLKVHLLDGRSDFLTELEAVEQRVTRLFRTVPQLSNGDR